MRPALITPKLFRLIRQIRLISLIGLVATCMVATLPRPVHAQDTLSLIVSPPNFNLEVKPGETLQKTIKLTNPSETATLTLGAMVFDFIVEDDQGTPIKVPAQASGRYQASPWFTLNEAEVTIPPRATVEVPVLIAVPTDALPGGHYAGVFFESLGSRNNLGDVSYIKAQVGSLFDLTIAGDIKYDALIQDFSVGQNMYEFGPVDFAATIENQSDTHIRPQTSITISNMLGRTIATISPETFNIFPYTSRSLTGTWDQVWGFGRYTATLSAAYGPGLTTERTLMFWILPWKLLAAVGVLLLVLLVTYITVRRHAKYRRDTRDTEIDELKRKIVELENQR